MAHDFRSERNDLFQFTRVFRPLGEGRGAKERIEAERREFPSFNQVETNEQEELSRKIKKRGEREKGKRSFESFLFNGSSESYVARATSYFPTREPASLSLPHSNSSHAASSYHRDRSEARNCCERIVVYTPRIKRGTREGETSRDRIHRVD